MAHIGLRGQEEDHLAGNEGEEEEEEAELADMQAAPEGENLVRNEDCDSLDYTS